MMPAPTILVVEDDPAIAEALQIILEDEGYGILLASSGEEALATLSTAQPALIMSDIWMPGMGGLALCAAIQRDPLHCRTPIILMSALSNRPSKEHCAYTTFLAKPMQFATMLAAVAQVITQAGDAAAQ